MAKKRWRLNGWEWGWEEEPRLCVEFEDGEKRVLQISELYADYDDDLACVAEDPGSYVPKRWFELMGEACEDCQAALGDMGYDDKWHWDSGNSPCRWHQQAELDTLYEHAKTHALFGSPE